MSKKLWLIVGCIVLAVIIAVISLFAVTNNNAINLEEQIKESQSSLETQEKRRVDLWGNLVDAIESANEYESDTLMKITEARTSLQSGDVESAEQVIDFVVEAYPTLTSLDNYDTYMRELATTENLIQNYRENLNLQIKEYNKYVRKFPNSMILNMMGYEKLDVDYLDFDAPSDAPQNLFDK